MGDCHHPCCESLQHPEPIESELETGTVRSIVCNILRVKNYLKMMAMVFCCYDTCTTFPFSSPQLSWRANQPSCSQKMIILEVASGGGMQAERKFQQDYVEVRSQTYLAT